MTTADDEFAAKVAEYERVHKGHEAAHQTMAYVVFFTFLFGSLTLNFWRAKYPRSYMRVSLLALWLIPPFLAFESGRHYFLAGWALFTLASVWIIRRSAQSPLHPLTPRLVHWWFSKVYQVSFLLGTIGFAVMMLTIFYDLAAEIYMFGAGMLYSGIYYGILGRDLIEICSETMASTLGYRSDKDDGIAMRRLEVDVCAICGAEEGVEPSHRLDCGHVFHAPCIRGWCLIGKHQVCPYCNEKVDVKSLASNAWDTRQLSLLQMLDYGRFLIAWLPLMIVFTRIVFYFAKLD
ncbi:RING finger protein 175-like protein [Ramicandelaber brevisporus]|nr:RING finger protein 175-like protein [Ramicandelaber brevisporus]